MGLGLELQSKETEGRSLTLSPWFCNSGGHRRKVIIIIENAQNSKTFPSILGYLMNTTTDMTSHATKNRMIRDSFE